MYRYGTERCQKTGSNIIEFTHTIPHRHTTTDTRSAHSTQPLNRRQTLRIDHTSVYCVISFISFDRRQCLCQCTVKRWPALSAKTCRCQKCCVYYFNYAYGEGIWRGKGSIHQNAELVKVIDQEAWRLQRMR